jgi:hypothetical protein
MAFGRNAATNQNQNDPEEDHELEYMSDQWVFFIIPLLAI